jgi:PAS domain S-box-containing protein
MRTQNPPTRGRAATGPLTGPRALDPVAVPAFLLRSAHETHDRRAAGRAAALDPPTSAPPPSLKSVIDAMPAIVFVRDREGRYVLANRAFAELWGLSVEQIVGKSIVDLMPEALALACASGGERAAPGVVALIDAAGTTRYFEYRTTPIAGEHGRPGYQLTLATEVTERKLENQRRAQVHDGLEQAVQERTAESRCTVRELEAFSYTISHDLQAPLRAMRGFARILREDHAAELSAPARRLLERIEEAGAALCSLVDGTLALAQVSKSELRRRPVDLSVLAQRVWQQLAELEPGCRATIEIAPGLHCTGDATLLRNALANLFANARKFSRGNPAAHVEFGARRGRGECVFFVRDNGAGFDMRYAGKLFSPFQRLHPVREFEGTGIGLASVRSIVERHGGRIWAEQSAPGAGATFCFTLGAAR